jgi:outer membrane biosynthesis protein TonB
MAGSKKKKSKKPTRAKSAPKRTATKTPRKKTTKPTKKASSAKKVTPKKKVTARQPQRPAPRQVPPRAAKTFAEKVRDCDAGTGIWFIVAGSVEHAAIQKRGSDGAVVIRTDAGVTEVVPLGNLFETADEARAARHR